MRKISKYKQKMLKKYSKKTRKLNEENWEKNQKSAKNGEKFKQMGINPLKLTRKWQKSN